ncbi:MAG: Radical SAM domain protein [Microgenomates group bacterium GW2011_GWC1_43_11]|uniref:Radical SAM domain protein n=1 Tax=Candidatus Gottesmanbacteria bacterium GW2011_GWA1_44_24b TaxID=1618437 RepID=A0A0G1IQV3_9BACT|nr:MAG: Radical SAM domain protein [Microgenomates group bacterium GW2011_GWC1_43_11]KKT61348.1 MAG: Radical SAM domain protein [Candidatus Gottesmanbacteria bacterium GW2011_GWA1_44_24b]HCM82896.1 AmmeMemoRadiSam system radical SAM enzyme [Patescibacteria group bacterium]
MKDCVLFSKLSENTVQCSACCHRCTIKDGATGICGVRKNYHGILKLLVWNKPTGVAVEPVEKKPLFHFLPGTPIFSLGTFGCNFGCLFCQNAMTSQLSKTDRWKGMYTKFLNQLKEWPPEKIVSYCTQNTISSIAFTYNEPSIFTEYTVDVMKLAKKSGIRGVFVSNGYQTKECLDYIEPYIDAFNIDLKSFRTEFYQTICNAKLQPVLDTIQRIYEMGKWMEITTLVIDGKNDSDEELTDIAKFIAQISPDIPWHLSACHPEYKMTDIRVTPKSTLQWAYEIGRQTGLHYVYLGNISNNAHAHTLCPTCKTILIERNYFDVANNSMKRGACPNCHTHIPGIWG